MTRRLGALLAAAALATLAGCPSGDVDPPSDVLTDPGAVIELATRDVAGLRTLAVEARATQYSDAQVIKGKLAILVSRPASVHFSGLSPTDDVVSVLATDGDRFTSFERGGKVCYTGRACPTNVGRLVPIAMEPEQLASVLFGRPPVIAHAGETVTWDRGAGAYRLELEGQDGVTQRLWVTHGRGEVKRAQLVKDGKVQVDLAYDDFGDEGGFRLPHRLDVKMKKGDVDLRLVYRDVDVNLELDAGAFRIPCPEGIRVEELPCPEE
ncbi:MAG: DUF4292 domain-containing protein [Myxococcales bacterium]|nr:DUF4292 domain-containing protein [Myxococcales bacterium]MCB9733194.1 DUF4292 domain-containing protein [Deltaproteobacteria bacterium]